MMRSAFKSFSPLTTRLIARRYLVDTILTPISRFLSILNVLIGQQVEEYASFKSVVTRVWAKVFIIQHFEDSIKATKSTKRVVYFFFDDKNEQKKTAVSLPRAIIHKLLVAPPALVRKHVTSHYRALRNAIYNTFATLWKILISITNDTRLDGVYYIIHALDECESRSCAQILRQFARLSHSSQHNFLKVICTGCPYSHIQAELSTFPMIHLERERKEDNTNRDIRLLIITPELEVGRLADNWQYSGA